MHRKVYNKYMYNLKLIKQKVNKIFKHATWANFKNKILEKAT